MTLRTPLTLVALAVLCVAGTVLGWRLLTQEAPGIDVGSTRDAGCKDRQISSGAKLRSTQIQVNVYNAGSVSGLANTTMRSLSRRGFVAGVVENAPTKSEPPNVLVLDPEPKSPSVQLVVGQFKGEVEVRKRANDLSDGVDIILGDGFRGIDDKARTSLSVRSRTDVCVPASRTS